MKKSLLILLFIVQSNLYAESAREFIETRITSLESGALEGSEGKKLKQPFFSDHHLVFFFSSGCPHCHNAAPHLNAWAKQMNVDVEARSFDDRPLPEFQEVRPVTKELVDAAFQGNTIQYPALFIMNNKTHALYPVVIGEFTFSELNHRMKGLIQKVMAFEGVSA